MAAFTNSVELYQQSEVINPMIQGWVNRIATLTNLIPKKPVTISERDFRLPALVAEAGIEGTYDPNGGGVGRGQNEQGVVMVVPFYPYRMAFELTQLAMDATQTREQALVSNFKTVMKKAPQQFASFIDRTFFTDGTPKLAQAVATATVGGVTTYQLDNTFGPNRIRRGQFVNPYSSDQVTPRLTAVTTLAYSRITAVAWQTNTITLADLITSAAATDCLLWTGLSGASPVGPYGLYYWISAAQTGTTATLNRATEPEVQSNSVSGAGGLSFILGLNLFHTILRRRGGDESMNGMIGIASLNAHAAAVGQVMNIQRIDLPNGPTNEMKDLLPGINLDFPYAGIKHKVTPLQDATRLDWISPTKTWGLGRVSDTKFYEQGGQRFFPTYATDGSPNAATWFAMTCNQNFFCENPGANGFVSAIPIDAAYQQS